MVEDFWLMTYNQNNNGSSMNEEKNDVNQHYRQGGNQSNYNGMLRMSKIDFQRFDGEKVME